MSGEVGRRRDPSATVRLLDATLDLLGEVGYAALTVDRVALAARSSKATVYRRWASKHDMMLDAIARMQAERMPRPDALVLAAAAPRDPDLRGALLTLSAPLASTGSVRWTPIARELGSVLAGSPDLVDAVNAALVAPWSAALTTVIQRSIEAGETAELPDVAVLAAILPTAAAYEAIFHRRVLSRPRLLALLDDVVMPALGH